MMVFMDEQQQTQDETKPQVDYKKLVEAALFMSPNAMSAQDIASVIGLGSVGHVSNYLNQLIAEYRERNTSLEIIEIGGKFMFSIKEPYASRVAQMASGPEISRGALRLLAYVSKNDNIKQSELVKIFGSSTYDYVKELVEKEFIEAKKEGRSRRVVLTSKFSEYFEVASTEQTSQA
jgi:segregation and condensation protein B